ncbi:MAG: V-type ATPase 116kDa subunit family protein [Candidatus Hodarchaeales archaeon]
MIETMYRTKLIGINDDIFELINVLRKLKVFHVIESSQRVKDDTHDDQYLRDTKIQLERLETRASAILSHVSTESLSKSREEEKIRSSEKIIKDLEHLLSSIEPDVRKIETERKELISKIEHLNRYKPVLRQCQPLIQEIDKKPGLESNLLMFNRKSDLGLDEFEKDINERTKGLYEVIPRRVDENYFAILLMYDKEFTKEIQSYLSAGKLSSFSLSPELRTVELRNFPSHIENSLSKHENDLKLMEEEKIKLLTSPDFGKIQEIYQEAADRLSAYQLAEKMGGTENTFEIEGFIPKSKYKQFENELKNLFENRILISKAKAEKDAPVLRKNPRIVRPFETITNLIQLPKYGSIDPTPLVFVFFTFFWGFMVGDVGYAATIFLIAAILRIRFKKNQQQGLQNITEIFMISCIVAMFFGVLYFEIFGDLGEILAHDMHLDITPLPLLDRYHDVQELLIISIIIGYGIIMGGMFLGVYNNFNLKYMTHVYGILLLILIWGSIPVLLVVSMFSPDLFSTAIIIDLLIIIIAIIILIKLEGIAGLIHVIERFSNILSFARLMAIGLVGAWMGKIANSLTTQLFPFGLLLGLGLHLINVVILILSPSIHSMRLNVFEFFTQFVLEGGNDYKPYGTN